MVLHKAQECAGCSRCEHNCVVLFVLKTKIANYSTSRIEQYDALWVVYTYKICFVHIVYMTSVGRLQFIRLSRCLAIPRFGMIGIVLTLLYF